jgi:hypothetical protein
MLDVSVRFWCSDPGPMVDDRPEGIAGPYCLIIRGDRAASVQISLDISPDRDVTSVRIVNSPQI